MSVVKIGIKLALPIVVVFRIFLGQEAGGIESWLSDAKPGGEDAERLGEAVKKGFAEEYSSVGKVEFILAGIEALDQGF